MMNPSPSFVRRAVTRVAGRLRFPYLFLITAVLFVLDVMIPDFLPLADEILLGLFTLLFGVWRERKRDGGAGAPPPEVDSGPTEK